MALCIARPRGHCRGLLFRVLAIGLGLAPLAACEAILRAFDLGRPCTQDDPFVGFSSIRPLFELSRDGTRYEIPRAHDEVLPARWLRGGQTPGRVPHLLPGGLDRAGASLLD